MTQPRKPAGVPTGGQFAPTNRPEAIGVELSEDGVSSPARPVSEGELPYPVDSSLCSTCGTLVWCYPHHPDEVWDAEREHWGAESGGRVVFACRGGAEHTPSPDSCEQDDDEEEQQR